MFACFRLIVYIWKLTTQASNDAWGGNVDDRTKRLRQLMLDRGLTISAVASLTGRSEATVRIWRCKTEGTRVIPANTLALIDLATEQKQGKLDLLQPAPAMPDREAA